MNEKLIAEARAFAEDAHFGQERKYTGEPYINHCAEVAQLVRDVGGTAEMVCAAWLHDTVEDGEVELAEIRARFGPTVADLVEALTDATLDKGNRKARKLLDSVRLAESSPEAQTIKLADLISNTSSIVEGDPHFSVQYLREKAALLEVMTRGNPALYERAKSYVKKR
jgi:(p)ppGpp synthase/HD superfamily hydrolase